MALCDAGIDKGEITISSGDKAVTDIPKNKGYKKIEINGDGNCGWYSMLEYFHLYGDKLILDGVPEDLKDIINSVKGSAASDAGRGPSDTKGGLSFGKDVLDKLRKYVHGLYGKDVSQLPRDKQATANQLDDRDMQELGKKMILNTICLYESGAEVPKWVYYNDSNQYPGVLVPTNAGKDYPIPMMLYHTGGKGTDSSRFASGHYSLLTLGEGDAGKVFNDFKERKVYEAYMANSSSVSPSTETTQASSTDSDCQSKGLCKKNKEFVDYYVTLDIPRPTEWSQDYARLVDLAYEKAKKAEDEHQSQLNAQDGQRRYRIKSSKFNCETEAYTILSNPDSWKKYDSTYDKCVRYPIKEPVKIAKLPESECQMKGDCDGGGYFTDYYYKYELKRPQKWSEKFKEELDSKRSIYDTRLSEARSYHSHFEGNSPDSKLGFAMESHKCFMEAYNILANPESWKKYDSTYEKCGGEVKAQPIEGEETSSSPAANAIPTGENIPPPIGQQTPSPGQEQGEQQDGDAETSSPVSSPQERQQEQMPQEGEQQQATQQPQPAATSKPQSGTISTTHVDVNQVAN